MSDVLDGYLDDGLQTLKLTGSWRLGMMGQLAEASLAPAPGGSVLIRMRSWTNKNEANINLWSQNPSSCCVSGAATTGDRFLGLWLVLQCAQ